MLFLSADRAAELPRVLSYPCVLLVRDEWNDYGYQTLFNLEHHVGPNDVPFKGRVKILQRGAERTNLPRSFEALESAYYSLGQSEEYYRYFGQLGSLSFAPILQGLNDIVLLPELALDIAQDDGYQASLLRDSEALFAMQRGRRWLEGISPDEVSEIAFVFRVTLPGAASPHNVPFDFVADATGLHRINVLIGPNGSGKTQLLATLANAISGSEETSASFSPMKPPVRRVLAVSYSVFDQFSRPAVIRGRSYTYCGLVHESRLLDSAAIWERLTERITEVYQIGRGGIWRDFIRDLFGDPRLPFLLRTSDGQLHRSAYDRLSSGQKILTLVITELTANIDSQTLVLFDEPETHLHPDMQASLARVLNELLSQFASYAVLATHSPVLVQEIPSRRVAIIERQGSHPVITRLTNVESFGENLSTITHEVFKSDSESPNYRNYLLKLVESGYTYGDILRLFDGRLGLEARAFLRAATKE